MFWSFGMFCPDKRSFWTLKYIYNIIFLKVVVVSQSVQTFTMNIYLVTLFAFAAREKNSFSFFIT